MSVSDDELLRLLKTRGPLETSAVASAFGMTRQGARQRLDALAAAGLAASSSRKEGVGRPRALWSLAPASDARFPDRHAELATELIDGVRAAFGEAGLERLIAGREERQRQRYRAALAGAGSLAEKVERLAEERSSEGYMAEVEREGEALLLIEHHCPVCAAAAACQGFCRSELALFQEALGEAAKVERVAHLLSGAPRCIYRIEQRAGSKRSRPEA